MNGRILVAYATRAGSTAGVAGAVTEVLRDAGYDVDLSLLNSDLIPEHYDAVILGGPIYMGAMREVEEYVHAHHAALESRFKAAFAVGMSFVEDDEEKRAVARDALSKAISPFEPAHLGYFAGKTDPAKLSFLQKVALKVVSSPIGDFRDYEAIKAWALEVSRDLGGSHPA
ncbi:flavodoxin domain-containing protein [Methanocalculus sp. MC3]